MAVWLQAKKSLQFNTGIVGTHKGFPNQKRIDVSRAHGGHIRRSENTAFRNQQTIIGNTIKQLEGILQRQLESVQVAVIDADQRRTQFQGPIQFLTGVHLDQRIKAVAYSCARVSSSSAATISRMQSAPIARASQT